MTAFAFPTWREWLFSAKAFAAAMLALYIALAAGLPRPYWAMATVYVVANPLSGATRSKALYRALGTLIGAAGSILLVPPLVAAPEILSLAVALWTGGFLFLSLLDRSPRAYVFMLAGYTLPLVALPAVGQPEQIFDIAAARAQEITLGIVCASLVNSLVLPGRIAPVLGARAGKLLTDAAAFVDALLTGTAGEGAAAGRQRMAADIRALDMMIDQLAYDPAAGSAVAEGRALRSRMAVLLPLLSSLADRLQAVREAGSAPTGLDDLSADVARFVRGEADAPGPDALRARIADLVPQGAETWDALLLASALERLAELVDLWQDCRDLTARILAGERGGRRPLALRLKRTLAAVPHYDYGLMIFSAVSAAAATFAAAMVWILTGWAEGAGFVAIAAVACSFFATSDTPALQMRSFVVWTAVATAIAGVYIFAVLPHVQDFAMLVAVFLVPFLLVGTLITRPQHMATGMLLGVNLASIIALQETYSADFAVFANGSLATIAGGLFALVWTLATRPFGVEFAARRLVRSAWADIAGTARGRGNADPQVFAGRMFDRLGQLVPRLAAGLPQDIASADVLADLRVGLNLLDLKRAEPGLAPALHPVLDRASEAVADLYAARAKAGAAVPAPETLAAHLDAALGDLLATPPGEARAMALQALVGLRRALLPSAPPPRLGPGEPVPFALAAE